MTPSFWADFILVLHFLYVLAIIVPVPLILVGATRKWTLVRNPWFRNIHLGMIGVVLLQTALNLFCPLTVWEQHLRTLAGETGYAQSFIEHWVGRLLYYDFPPWVFTILYLSWSAAVILLYFFIPPKRGPRPSKNSS